MSPGTIYRVKTWKVTKGRRFLTLLLGFAAALAIPAIGAQGPPAATIRVMPLGDSITEGKDGSATYRYWLQRELERSGLQVDFVGSRSGVFHGRPRFADFDPDHEGHWGWTTRQVLERIDEWARAATPDVVLLHLGTNDLVRDPSVIPANLSAIIDRLRQANPSVVVLLARLIPPKGFPQEVWRSANDAIDRMGSAKSTPRSPVVIVAQDRGFDASDDTYDGVHPNESGEKKMAKRWFEALSSACSGSAPDCRSRARSESPAPSSATGCRTCEHRSRTGSDGSPAR
jgi:acyl-CoA thioesterase-1